MKNKTIIENIRLLINGYQPKENISEILYTHKCDYLLSLIKTQDEYTKKAAKEQMLNSLAVSTRYKVCQTILEQLNEFPYAVIKGAVLSKAAYKNTSVRKSGDIDLLIRRENVDAIKSIMKANGFIQGRATENGVVPFTRKELLFQSAMSHQIAPFIKPSSNPFCPFVNVDINLDILWGESKCKSDMEYVLRHTFSDEISGFKIKRLEPEMELISLCLHHYKDMNSIYLLAKGSLRLSLFCDIYFYLKNTAIKFEKLKHHCNALRITEYVYYCIYYTYEIFGDDLLKPYLILLENEEAKNILDTFGLNEDERKKWNIDFFERLFDKQFLSKFEKQLNENDKAKILLNRQLM